MLEQATTAFLLCSSSSVSVCSSVARSLAHSYALLLDLKNDVLAMDDGKTHRYLTPYNLPFANSTDVLRHTLYTLLGSNAPRCNFDVTPPYNAMRGGLLLGLWHMLSVIHELVYNTE